MGTIAAVHGGIHPCVGIGVLHLPLILDAAANGKGEEADAGADGGGHITGLSQKQHAVIALPDRIAAVASGDRGGPACFACGIVCRGRIILEGIGLDMIVGKQYLLCTRFSDEPLLFYNYTVIDI